MDDILLLTDKVRNTLFLGESHFREFKTAFEGRPDNKRPRRVAAICQDIGEALVAFANADGGAIIIGVEDNGQISGIPHSDVQVAEMLHAVHTHVYQGQVLPLVNANELILDERRVLYFSVNKGTTMIYQLPDGRCVKRKDKATLPASVQQISFERQEILSREFDSQFVDGATVADLDVSLVQGIAQEYINGLSVERYLQQMGLAEYGLNVLKLRRAALLLFAKKIDRWHPRSQIRILKVNGDRLESGERYNVVSDSVVAGNIFELIFKSWDQIRNFIAFRTQFGDNAQFQQQFLYPEDAVRESVLNAIAHRDYSSSNSIEIYIYNNRLEIKSPGALLSTLSLANLYQLEGSHESRNSLIAMVLRENKLMRELGEGMRRIFNLMQEQELERPELYSNGLWFSVILRNASLFSQDELSWLSQFKQLRLSTRQKRVLLLGKGNQAFSANQIFQALGLANNETEEFTRQVTQLRNFGVLDNMLSSNQVQARVRKENMDRKDIKRYKVIEQG